MSTISAPPRNLSSRLSVPAAPVRRLSFSHHMPPGAVHKASATEVFLTDALRLEEDRFAVAARWHRDRFLHHDGTSRQTDPLLLVETVRQALIHVTHRFYGVPQGHPFVLNTLEFDLLEGGSDLPEGGSDLREGGSHLPGGGSHLREGGSHLPGGGSHLREGGSHLPGGGSHLREGGSHLPGGGSHLREGGGTPIRQGGQIPVVLDITCARQAKSPRRLGMVLDAVATADGARVGRVRMHWEVLDARLYALARNRTRQQAQERPAGALPRGLRRPAPREVGYAHDEHVLLTRDAQAAHGAFWLDTDPGHPVLYDHPCDHVPGMVLLEAFRQAVTATVAPRRPTLTRVSAAFKTFGETDAPVSITVRPGSARPAGPSTVEITAAQSETALVTARVAYHLPRSPERHGVAS
ncbi:AfsA-related hotdog domain-containing protein [Streptomyces sediminimaris]|uniref:AfsA-related hotdog domain-containing protein n=1 Tax=Streptomyces sediminimaris TaxID=3383721 RepID=UPI003999ED58